MVVECTFCRKFGEGSYDRREWYDEPLASTTHFLLVPAIGAFVEGYVMIVAKRHHAAMANLPRHEFVEFMAFKQEVQKIVREAYGTVLMFEHGVSDPKVSPGTCVDHAHWQILPFDSDIIPHLKRTYGGQFVRSFEDLRRPPVRNRSYMYVEAEQGVCFVTYPRTAVPSQYIRRIVSKELGCADCWDWAMFPYWDRVAATISRLKPFIGQPGVVE